MPLPASPLPKAIPRGRLSSWFRWPLAAGSTADILSRIVGIELAAATGQPVIVSFAEPGFPPPTFSVYEERVHSWVVRPQGMEHMA